MNHDVEGHFNWGNITLVFLFLNVIVNSIFGLFLVQRKSLSIIHEQIRDDDDDDDDDDDSSTNSVVVDSSQSGDKQTSTVLSKEHGHSHAHAHTHPCASVGTSSPPLAAIMRAPHI